MSSQLAIDFEAAKFARDEGIRRAEDNANAHNEKWSDLAFEAILEYARTHETLTSEDVRTNSDVPPPPSERAWGGPFVRAKKAGVLVFHSYGNARDPKVHCNVVTIWKSLIYGGGHE